MYRLLIVEDDPVIAGEVAQSLRGWGYAVHLVEDFEQVLRDFADFDPQLVLLDLKLPGFNGFHWCREIRRVSTVPILFLTSAGDNINAVTAMNLGADDLVAKPFDLSVLAAKVEALLRRTYGFAATAALTEHQGLLHNAAAATVQQGEHRVELTRNENRILQMLLENRGQIVTRDTLMVRLWETDSFVDENTLTVNVGRLRKNLPCWTGKNLSRPRKAWGT